MRYYGNLAVREERQPEPKKQQRAAAPQTASKFAAKAFPSEKSCCIC